MASNLEVNVLDYVTPFTNTNIQVQPKKVSVTQPLKKVEKKSAIIVKGTKKPLTKLNYFMMSMIFSLLLAQSFIYFHSVQAGVGANKLQAEINKLRESNDFLKVDLANLKELTKIEKIAINSLGMTLAENQKINYLPLPQQIDNKALYTTSIAPRDKEVLVPVGY